VQPRWEWSFDKCRRLLKASCLGMARWPVLDDLLVICEALVGELSFDIAGD
jgi:hypothetical protein